VTNPRQLLRGRQSGRTGADDGDGLAGLDLRRLRHDPAFFPAFVDDRMLDRLDAHGVGIDVQRARGFTRGRTDAAGKIREVVGRVQDGQRLLPVAAVHQVVPVGNDVVDRAAGIAEGNAAVHAARALQAGLFVVESDDELAIMLETRLGGSLLPPDADTR
jgi:hypothetical protein